MHPGAPGPDHYRVYQHSTIGIGSGAQCDGQVLVCQDMLGTYGDFTPKFARQFAPAGQVMREGFESYIAAVRDGSFPADCHTFAADDSIFEQLK